MMIIADSGSTKTSWVALDGNTQSEIIETEGLNPFFATESEMVSVFEKVAKIVGEKAEQLSFYGAGCGNTMAVEKMNKTLSSVFQCTNIDVFTDLHGAARAAWGMNEGLVLILGTGSHAALCSGGEIVDQPPSLGYILGDRGSGASLGKELLKLHYTSRLSADLHDSLENFLKNDRAGVIRKIYSEKHPNRFLAGLCPFLANEVANPIIGGLIEREFFAFFETLTFWNNEFNRYPAVAIGSVAHHFKSQLISAAAQHNVVLESIEKSPLPGLVRWHQAS
jgi:glucosamine kinase